MTDEQAREEMIRNSGEWATTPPTPPAANPAPAPSTPKLSLADLKQRAKKNNPEPPMATVPPVAPAPFFQSLNSEAGFSAPPSAPLFEEPFEEVRPLPFEPVAPRPLEASPTVQPPFEPKPIVPPTTNPLLAKILGQASAPTASPAKPSDVAPAATAPSGRPIFDDEETPFSTPLPPSAPPVKPLFVPPTPLVPAHPTFSVEDTPFSTPLPSAPVRPPAEPASREDFSLPVIPAWDLPETVSAPAPRPVKKEEPIVESVPTRAEDSEDLEELERQQQAATQKARDLSNRKAEIEARKIREAAEAEKEHILAEAEKQKHARLAEAEERFNAVVAVEKTADEARRSKDQAAAEEREKLRAASEAELAAREAELSLTAAAREAELSAAAADLEAKRNAYREELAARQVDAQSKVAKMWEEVEQARSAAAEQRVAADAAFLAAEKDRATAEAQRLRLEQSTAQEQEKMRMEMENFRASLISEFQNRTVETERIADERIKEELTRLEQKESAADARMQDLDLREEKDRQNQILVEARLAEISQSAELAAQEREKWRSEARTKDRMARLAEQRLLDLQEQLIAAQQTPSIADDAAVEAEVHEATRASLDAESASQEAQAQLAQAEERALALEAEQKAIASRAELAEAESARNQEARHFLDLQQTAAREQRQQVESYRVQLETNPDEELPPVAPLIEMPIAAPETAISAEPVEAETLVEPENLTASEASSENEAPTESEPFTKDEETPDHEEALEAESPLAPTGKSAIPETSTDGKESLDSEEPTTPKPSSDEESPIVKTSSDVEEPAAVIVGGTGTGKTSFLKTLLAKKPAVNEELVSAETSPDGKTSPDVAEPLSAEVSVRPEDDTEEPEAAEASLDNETSSEVEELDAPNEEGLTELVIPIPTADLSGQEQPVSPEEETAPEDIFATNWPENFETEATPPNAEPGDDIFAEPPPEELPVADQSLAESGPLSVLEPSLSSDSSPSGEVLTTDDVSATDEVSALDDSSSLDDLLFDFGSVDSTGPIITPATEEEEEIKPRYESPQADLSESAEEVAVLPSAIVERPNAPEEDDSPLFTLSDMLAAPAATSPVKPSVAPVVEPEPVAEIEEEEIAPLDFSLNEPTVRPRVIDPATLGPMTRRELVRPRAIDLGAMNRPPKEEVPEQTPAVMDEEPDPLVPILQTIDYSGARPEREAASPEKESLLDFEMPSLNTPAVRPVNRHNVGEEEQNNILGQLFWTLIIVGIALVIAYFFGGALLSFAQNFLHNPGKSFNDLLHSITHIFGF
jgi:hypothetical protein